MEWVYVALIIASMVYSGSIIVDYTNFSIEVRPQIRKLESKALEWGDAADAEIAEKDRLKTESSAIKEVISDLQLAVQEAKLRTQSAMMRKKRLDMVLLKTSIRSRRTVRSHHF